MSDKRKTTQAKDEIIIKDGKQMFGNLITSSDSLFTEKQKEEIKKIIREEYNKIKEEEKNISLNKDIKNKQKPLK